MIPNNIPKEIIENEDQQGLDEIAEAYGLELDHRKTFNNQVSDVNNRIAYVNKENARKREEHMKDPRNWKFTDEFKLSKHWGPNPNGGIYLQRKSNGLQFFVPANEIAKYRAD